MIELRTNLKADVIEKMLSSRGIDYHKQKFVRYNDKFKYEFGSYGILLVEDEMVEVYERVDNEDIMPSFIIHYLGKSKANAFKCIDRLLSKVC